MMECLSEWCDMTALHCVSNAKKSKKIWSKILWSLLILFSGTLATYQCVIMIMDYVDDDQKWITSVNYEMAPNGAPDWPNLTVCHMNIIYKSKLKIENVTDPYHIAYMNLLQRDGIKFYDRYQADQPLNETELNRTIIDLEKYYKDPQNLNDDITLQEMMMNYGRNCNDTIIDCGTSDAFATLDNHKGVEGCCVDESENIRWNCFSMQPARLFGKYQRNTGNENSGIYFLFNPKINDYYDKLLMYGKANAGLLIKLHYGMLEASTPSTLLLSPGIHTMVGLMPEKHKIAVPLRSLIPWDTKKGNCSTDANYKYLNENKYSQSLCKIDCWIDLDLRECKCTTQPVRLKDKSLSCVGHHIFKCVTNGKTGSSNQTYDDGFNVMNCIQKCPEACTYDNVQAVSSQAIFPAPSKLAAFTTYVNRAFPEATGGNFTGDDTKQLILLEMFFQTFEWKVLTKMEKTSLGQMFSNIGGALGIWTGLSLLSIVQAFVYLWTCLSEIGRRLCKRH